MLNRSGNTTDNLCFRYRFRDVFSRFRCCVYNGTGPLLRKHNGNMELHVSATFPFTDSCNFVLWKIKEQKHFFLTHHSERVHNNKCPSILKESTHLKVVRYVFLIKWIKSNELETFCHHIEWFIDRFGHNCHLICANLWIQTCSLNTLRTSASKLKSRANN